MRHKHSVTEDPVKVVGIAAVAATIGAVVALIFTPRNGNQVRKGLKRRVKHLKDDAHNRFSTTIDEVGDTATDVKDRLQDTAESAVSDVKSKIKEADKASEDIQGHLSNAIDEAKATRRKDPPKAQ